MTRKTGIVASGVLLSLLLACQPGPLPGTPATGNGQPAVVSLGATNGAAISIALQAGAGMGTKALPKSAADVHHYKVTLWDSGTNLQVGGALNISGTTGQFVGVPAGTYYIKANAYDDALESNSLVQGGLPVQSINTVTVSGGVATYSGGQTSLVVNLPLLDGTVGSGSSNVSIGNRTVVLTGADKSGLSLWNGATRRATPNAVNPSITYALSNVQVGNKNGTSATHEIWAFAVNSGAGTASVPKPYGTGTNVSGAPTASVSIVHSAQTVETGGPVITVGAGWRIQMDANNNMYYYDGTNLRTRQATGNYTTDLLALDNSAGALTGWAITTDASLFFSTGTDIKYSTGTTATAAAQAITAPNVGKMAVDEARCIYYIETGTNKIRRCVWTGSAYLSPVDVVTLGSAPTMLAADSYGSVYFSNGTDIYKCTLDVDETTYSAATKVVTAAGVTSLNVDRVGNIYFTDASNTVKLVGASETTIYNMIGPGSGAATDSLTGAAPAATNLNTPRGVVMGTSGRFLFLSQGPSGQFLRYVP